MVPRYLRAARLRIACNALPWLPRGSAGAVTVCADGMDNDALGRYRGCCRTGGWHILTLPAPHTVLVQNASHDVDWSALLR